LASANVIQFFITHESKLEVGLKKLKTVLKSNPIFCIAHHKKSSKISTDLKSMQQWEILKKF
jgi:hypothetical protein